MTARLGRMAVASIAIGVALVAAPRPADAGRLLVAPTYAEADLLDEAGGATLLLRAALESDARPVVPAVEVATIRDPITLGTAKEALARLGADRAVWTHIDRLGPTMVMRASLIGESGEILAQATATAPEADLRDLCDELVEGLAKALEMPKPTVPDASLGQLRPFVLAERLGQIGRWALAAAALESADPVIAARVSTARAAARQVWSRGDLPRPSRLLAVLAGGTPRDILDVAGADTGTEARAARAWAKMQISDLAGARGELANIEATPLIVLARAATAAVEQRSADRDAAILALLAGAGPSGTALRWLGRLPAGALPADLELKVVTAADAFDDRRLGSAIGLRAAEGGLLTDAALGLIHPIELDGTELARLRAVLGRLPASGEADRLRVGVALRAGDLDAARAALASLGLRGDEATAALYRGRIAWASGDLDTAAEQFERAGEDAGYEAARVEMARGKPDRAREAIDRARAAVAAFNAATRKRMGMASAVDDPNADLAMLDELEDAELPPTEKGRAAIAAFQRAQASQIRLIAEADLAAGGGDDESALARLREAELLAPGARETQERMAISLERKGDRDGAARARAAAGLLAPGPKTAAAPVLGSGSGAADDTPIAERPRASASLEVEPALATAITTMLANLDARWLAGRTVAIAPGVVDAPGLLSLRKPEPGVLADGLTWALEKPPFEGRVLLRSSTALPRELAAVQGLAARGDAEVAILYELTLDGSDALVSLVVVDATNPDASTNTQLLTGRLDGADLGLASWNLMILVIVGGTGLVLFALVSVILVRGSAEVIVNLKSDPDAREEAFSVSIGRSSARPSIGDPVAYRKALQRDGQKLRRKSGRLIGARTKLKVTPGEWVVHLVGLYDRGSDTRVLDDTYSQAVSLKRGQVLPIVFDLTPAKAELRLRIHDNPPSGIKVWIDDRTADVQVTNATGHVTLLLNPGEHVLHVQTHDLEIERAVTIGFAKIEALEINLTRERKLAEVSGGQSLKRTYGVVTPPPGALAPVTSHAVTFDGDGAATASPASAATMAIPGTSPAFSSDPGAAHARSAPAFAGTAAGVRAGDPGSVLCGRYRILRKLGQGAMGVVYHAHDQNLEREVAVKALESSLKSHPDALRLFVEEAKALAQLHHPNIVSVFDQTSDAGEQYLVMEFVNGTTLEDIVDKRGILPLAEALDITDQLCAGLAYAHSRRVIHRDIKPANIFVSSEGVVKLGDFGLARVMRELSIRKTEIRGTPLYMAPEQIVGTNVSGKSDLYAVGGTLFTMLCGRPPFIEGEILYHQLHTPPPAPSSLNPDVPAEVDALMAKLLEKKLEDRLESASAIRDWLKTIPR